MTGHSSAVATCVQSVNGIRNQSVESLSGSDKVVDIRSIGHDFGVEIIVAGQKRVELIFQILIEIDSGITVVDQ